MNVNSKLVVSPSRRYIRTVIAYVLLLMIGYGALVEAVHSHGHVPTDQTNVVAICDAGGSQSSNTGHSHHIECPMCQFQQQLFNGLAHAPLFGLSPSTEFAFVANPSIVYQTSSTTPASGRAPPVSLL